jgi:hypothetical protein
VRADMAAYATAVRSGAETGATGKPFTAIVHIGIGGSDLGPRVVWDALRPLEPTIDLRFVANIDPRDMAEALTGLDPETTLVVVVSKTFTTQETLANADAGQGLAGRLSAAPGATSISSASPPRRTRRRPSAAPAPSASATGSAAAIPCGRRSACRCAIALGPDVFEAGAGRRPGPWTSISSRPRWRRTPRSCWRWPRSSTSTAGPPGPHRRPLRPRPAPPARLPAAAGDGIERQAGEARRLAGRHRHRPGRLRRARHQRPARLLPADPSGAGRSSRPSSWSSRHTRRRP